MADHKRPVTERDFRRPEFRDADPADYEFREDGAVVRKDRWETGIRTIVSILGLGRTSWEISEVVERIRAEQSLYAHWQVWPAQGCCDLDIEDRPDAGCTFDLKLDDGSVLKDASYDYSGQTWRWRNEPVRWLVTHWR